MSASDDHGSGPPLPNRAADLLAREAERAESLLGPAADWPAALRTALDLLMSAEAQIVLFWGPDYVALYNDAYAPTIGAKHPGAFGRPARENWSELWDDLEPLLRSVRSTGQTISAKDRPFRLARFGREETVYFDISYQALHHEDGSVAGVLCIVSDTTERVLTERRLNFTIELGDRLRALSEPSRIKSAAAETVGQRLAADRAGYAEFSDDEATFQVLRIWTRDGVPQFGGAHAISRFGPDLLARLKTGRPLVINDVEEEPEDGRAAFRGISVGALVAAPLVKAGRLRAVFFVHSCAPRAWESAEIGFVVAAAERTWAAVEQARAEQRLSESEARYEAIANSVDQMIWSTLPDGQHDYFNDRWYEFTGVPYGSTDGDGWSDVFHPDDRERAWATWRRSLETGEPYYIEYRLRHRSGQYRWVVGRAQCVRDPSGAITRWYGTCTDVHDLKMAEARLRELNETLEARVAAEVAERQQAEEALRQAQKMESLGQLTGGVAHDFNNLLQVVVGNLDILKRNLPPDAPRLSRAADNAMTGAQRAATLTQRLLAFSRRQPLAPQPIDPNRLVAGMAEMLSRTLGETVELVAAQAPDLWRVEVDPNQLEAAVINLAVNARDAMPDGGKLTIETANVRLDGRYAAEHAEVKPGAYVAISVSDTGAGMDRGTVERAFEPFFTTKEVGKGTGLGLSMVYGFVKQSGGHVKIYSEPEHGTTVRIYLPRFTGEEPSHAGPAEPETPPPAGSSSETILVVEDDDDVRVYSAGALRELGYRVLEARDGISALAVLGQADEPIDLLFSDVVLPGGMNGEQLAGQARGLRPRLKVLFTTGYARNAIVHHGRLDSGVELITKPFAFSDLAARVRDILDAADRGRR
ncbi:PAS domain S-box protein [Methylopila musalis]|uniref:histidine kinase n=1 Tax=Methylopila musalis TaxID=1134781 RepID=A0ABW3Z649_9HYPH